MTSLSYGGQSFFQNVDYVVQSAVFRAPDGTLTNAFANGWVRPTTATLRSNPTAFEQVYFSGQTHQFTVKVSWIQTDNRTLEAVSQITNNDPVNTLVTVQLQVLSLTTPGPATQYNANIPPTINEYIGSPVTFLSGTWGSVALWQSGYPTPASQWSWYGSPTTTNFYNLISTTTVYGPNTYSLETPPSKTSTLTQFVRFGTLTDTALTLAPEAYAEYATVFPSAVNWPDRRPIANWMIAGGSKNSAINPRSYLWDGTINVSNSALFQSKVLSAADSTIGILNGMSVHPQGIIIWDLEGEEFLQPFTYVGSPDNLPNLAPEMDAVADAFFAKFKAAGYRVGVTVRAQHFGTGNSLPATCSSSPTYDLQDKFILLSATYPYRGYVCTATTTWTVSIANGPYAQTYSKDYTTVLATLQQKITYARSRWGATLFYVDSSVWEGGTPIDPSIFRTLATEFPDCLIIPENTNAAYFGSTAPYNWSGGNWRAAGNARPLYPGAFQVFNVADLDLQANYAGVLAMVQAGDILLFRGWYSAPEIPGVQQIYSAAGIH